MHIRHIYTHTIYIYVCVCVFVDLDLGRRGGNYGCFDPLASTYIGQTAPSMQYNEYEGLF